MTGHSILPPRPDIMVESVDDGRTPMVRFVIQQNASLVNIPALSTFKEFVHTLKSRYRNSIKSPGTAHHLRSIGYCPVIGYGPVVDTHTTTSRPNRL